jgi:exonuclease III
MPVMSRVSHFGQNNDVPRRRSKEFAGSSPTTCPGRGIAVTLSWSGSRPLKIIGVYAPSGVHANSHHPPTAALVNFFRTELTVAERLNQSVLILGDFNAVLNPSIDRRNSSLIEPKGIILPLLCGFGLSDCYRSAHPVSQEFTFFRKETSGALTTPIGISRIDSIWADPGFTDRLLTISHEAAYIPQSDHSAVVAEFHLSDLTQASIRRLISHDSEMHRRRVVDWKRAEKHRLQAYSVRVSSGIARHACLTGSRAIRTPSELRLAWEKLRVILASSAKKHIPSRNSGYRPTVVTHPIGVALAKLQAFRSTLRYNATSATADHFADFYSLEHHDIPSIPPNPPQSHLLRSDLYSRVTAKVSKHT